ncbi:UvrD-helicase domain-containing protein [Botrimarina sp.]|uniref:UvrD-helicase domain-containing protein n=1 Tax=Botrimarina sp. TaxID=2795802 RepID=UPI0032EE6934
MSLARLTEEQRTALRTHGVPITVDAGAGCGKTFVLTERFLSHLEPDAPDGRRVDLERLAAITFTDAAAREMRARVRARCRQRLADAGGDHAAHWRSLLRRLDAARISTIHSFASSLIREHALQLGVDPSFAVIDPAEADVLKSQAVDAVLRERLLPGRGGLDEGLVEAAAALELGALRSRVSDLVDHADSQAFARWRNATPDDAIDAWRIYYRDRVAPRYARDLLEDPMLGELEDLLAIATPTTPVFVQRVEEIRDTLESLRTGRDPDAALKRLHTALEFSQPGSRKHVYTEKDWPDKETKSEYSEARKQLHDKLSKQRRAGDPESMRAAAELGLRLHDLAWGAAERYRHAKHARGGLDNDDLLRQAHRLLTAPDLADARRSAAAGVRVLLVDEFQDTDPLQSELVQALAGLGAAPFTVGDFKQSIYRFRGAEPEVFNRLRAATPEEGRLSLSMNFRSQPGVLDFVNTLFEPIFVDHHYQPLRPSRGGLSDEPAVEMLWTAPPAGDGGAAPSAEERRTAEARRVADWIAAAIGSGRPLVEDKAAGGARGPRAGDFAVLLRALSDVSLYEDALRAAGLEYYLVGGHAFYSQQEVYDLLNLLRAVLSECDDIALAGVLRSPMFGLPDEALYWLARGGGLNAGLADESVVNQAPPELREPLRDAARVVRCLRREKDRCGAAELLDLAWSLTGYDATLLAEFLGARKLANLEKLAEQARRADATGGGLVDFARRLAEFVKQPPKEALAATTAGDADVVRVMTVHAAKGLEFPIVVLPDLNRKEQHDRTQATFDPALGPLVKPPAPPGGRGAAPPVGIDFWRAAQREAESAEKDRLFYVACTRAADHLVLSSCWAPGDNPEGPWLKRLAERFDLATGATLGGGPALARVAADPPPARGRAGQGKSELHSVLGALADSAPPPAARPSAVGRIEFDPAAATTFSVSRLNGNLQATAPATPEPHGDRSRDASRRLGSLVHAVAEHLPLDGTPPDLLRLVERLAAEHARRDVDATIAEATRQAESLLASGVWRSLAAASERHRELEFFLPWRASGEPGSRPAVLRGYIDAVWREADGWRIVDYKTNRIGASEVAKAAERYRFQMSVYAHAVEAALGEPPARLTLAFLSPGVEVDLAWDAAAREASVASVDARIAEKRRRETTDPP